MVEIINVEDAKNLIGQNVKFRLQKPIGKVGHDLPIQSHMLHLEAEPAILNKVMAYWEYSESGDKCLYFDCYVTVMDPKRGKEELICAGRIFINDADDEDIENTIASDKISKLQEEITALRSKIVIKDTIKKIK